MEDLYKASTGLPAETVRAYNRRLVEFLSLYLNLAPGAIEEAMLRELTENCHISRAEAYAHCLSALADWDVTGKDRIFFRYWLLPAIHELAPTAFLQDPYFQSLSIPNVTEGRWSLKTEHLRPLEAFVCNDFRTTRDGRMIPQIGFFSEEYPFPAVLEDGREWMTLQPNEIVTARPAIAKARGRVLAFGLGLGYFAYHAATKPDVTSVTVVDISPDVISLFKKHILPQIPHREKITLICEDAFAFADTKLSEGYDFVFADIWHDAGDGKELYLRMKEYEKKHPQIDFAFWLEDTIRCYLDERLW